MTPAITVSPLDGFVIFPNRGLTIAMMARMAREEQPIIREMLVGGWDRHGPQTASEGGALEGATSPLESGSGEVLPRAPEPLAAGTCVGRYEILELVGSGGSGRVYRARDPQLGRFVALKLLRAGTLDGMAPARLLQEARTLARLSHPNIVAAYDVGVHDGALFVAMEFIDRVSMREWLTEPRAPAEIVRVLVAAGRGLAAAHAADICHCDFKPANVMIASDGQVRVVDFGLARTAQLPAHMCAESIERDDGDPGTSVPALASDWGRDRNNPRPARAGGETERLPLSTSSALAGTPGFMAPEQLLGQPADARSDQFSYAVTAFLALTGAMPYPAAVEPRSPSQLAERRALWPPRVSRRIRRVIDRGLEPDPSRRYPSLALMVNALERAAAPRKPGVWGIGLGVAAACGSLAVAVAVARQAEPAVCGFDASSFAGVWDSARRSAVERAFQATNLSGQADAFQRIAGRLDAFRDEWLHLRRESCEAAHVRPESSERVLERTVCLDRALAGATTLVDALSRVGAADVDDVAGASPPALRACSDTSASGDAGAPPSAELEAEIAEIERQIAGIAALIGGGFRQAAVEQAQRALERARATGHAPTIARATAYMGRSTAAAALTSEQRSESERWLREGIHLAAESGQDLLLARTASFLFVALAYRQLRIEESEAMLPMVEAMVARAGNPVEPRVEVLMGMSRIAIERRRFSEAITTLEEARRLAPSAEGEVANYAFLAARDLSQVRRELGQDAAAVQAAQDALDGIRGVYGASHPRMLFGLADLAVAQAKAGLRERALQSIAEARQIATTLPADEPRVKNVTRAEGVVWEYLGECQRALPPLREALQLFTAAHGATHPLTTGVLGHYASCLEAMGRSAEAIATREQMLSNQRSHGAASMWLAETAFSLAKDLWPDRKQRARALALIDEAQSIWRKEGAAQPLEEAASWLAAHAG